VSPVNDLVRFALVAFYPRVDDVPGLDELGVDEKIEALRREATWLFWVGVVGAALLFQITPILTLKRPWIAASLDEEELDVHAYALATYPVYVIRQTAVLLKLVAGMFWAGSPEIRALVALPPYGPDPGTRRLEAIVPRPAPTPRVPAPSLVTLGKREAERGRGGSYASAGEEVS
jgi:hypothetical protein